MTEDDTADVLMSPLILIALHKRQGRHHVTVDTCSTMPCASIPDLTMQPTLQPLRDSFITIGLERAGPVRGCKTLGVRKPSTYQDQELAQKSVDKKSMHSVHQATTEVDSMLVDSQISRFQ